MEENLMCRLCLVSVNVKLIPVFGMGIRDTKLSDKLLQHLSVEIKEDDALPKFICIKCLETVENFNSFYLEVSNNQTMLDCTVTGTQTRTIVFSTNGTEATYYLQNQPVLGSTYIQLPVEDTIEICGKDVIPEDDALSTMQCIEHEAMAVAIATEEEPEDGEMLKIDILDNGSRATLPTYDEAQKIKEQEQQTDSEEQQESMSDDNDMYEDVMSEILYEPVSEPEPDPEINVVDKAIDYNEDTTDWEEQKEDALEPVDQTDTESTANDNDEFELPTKMVQNGRLIIRGNILNRCLNKFYRLVCEKCETDGNMIERTFRSVQALLKHYGTAHSMKGYVSCCGLKKYLKKHMALHMARHVQPEAFKCPECNKMMTCPKILQYHIQNHLPENRRPLKCQLCPKRFSYSSALLTHESAHRLDLDRKRHMCHTCGKEYRTRKRLQDHMACMHSENKQSFHCHICVKQFTSNNNLVYHMTTHQPSIHQVQCDQCQKWLKNKLCLRKHMMQHSQVRHGCDQCEYSAVNRQCLLNHMRVQHSDDKPYRCDCGKAFKLKTTLLNHKVQHTGERKFECEFCQRTFASSGNYYAHRKRMHPEELARMNQRKEEEKRKYRNAIMLRKEKSPSASAATVSM